MTTLKFDDTHNMVAFLSKPAESEGFEQIVDFLNAHTIKYALTINPTIYTSCIKQFWATVKAKTINGKVQLQALVDGKKIIITESIVRRDLQLEDAEGVDCLPNATIFEQLALMSSKTTAWNEFSSTMASVIICLATNQKFNFSKYIFEKEICEGSAMPTDPHHTPTIIQPSTSQPQKSQKPRRPKRKDTKVPQPSGPTTSIADEDVNEKMDDSSGPRRQETIGDIIAQTRVLDLETTKTTQANEIASLKRRVKKLERRRGLRTHKLKRLDKVGLVLWAESLNMSVNDLDGDEVIVDNVDVVKTVEETRSVVEEVTAVIEKTKLVSAAEETVNAAATTVSTASTIPVSVATTTTTTTVITDDEITLAKVLTELKSAKLPTQGIAFRKPTTPTLTTTAATTITVASTRPRDKWIVILEQEQAPTPTFLHNNHHRSRFKTRVKAKMVELELVKKMSKKDLLRLNKELAFKLQAEKEEERLAREKAQQIKEANIAWDDVHAKIKVDYQRKHFAAKRAEEKRNKPPTRAQQRSIMYTYLKNMEGWKPKSLKNNSFANIQELFEKAMKRVNTFVDYRTELLEESSKKAETELEENLKKAKAEVMEGSLKRACTELEQESIKKQKVDEDTETVELQSLMQVIPYEEEVAINAIPLATKPLTIVNWKIHKEGKYLLSNNVQAESLDDMITGRKDGSSKNTYSKLSGRDSDFSSSVIAMNSSYSEKISSSRRVPLTEWRMWKTGRGGGGVSGFGMGEVVLSTFEELQMLGFFLQMGFTLILATIDGLDVGLLGDVIGEDDCDEDE
ncbi:hypothetical protein Tco_0331457 [Tanacetum coccineum]